MRHRLTRSDNIFSGIKTFHELNEAFPSLLDENGNRKPFEQFLNDVRKIDETYNEHYLRAEYNFVQQSANMAAKWEDFQKETDHEETMSLGEEALQEDKKGVFRFNSGKEQKTMPDYNPYTIKRCKDCDVAKGDVTLAFVLENQLCEACKMLHRLQDEEGRRRLTREERYEARRATNEWADEHLQEERLSEGSVAKRLHITHNDSGHDLILSRTFFGETFYRNFHNRRLAETMRLATKVESTWKSGALNLITH